MMNEELRMLELYEHGLVTEIKMNRPPANALTTAFVAEIQAGLDQAIKSGARAVILSGREGMFSAGLDVPELLGQDRAAILEFWTQYMGLNRSFASSPVPVVAAIGGHSPAGGAVMAVHCDYRIAVDGAFKIGFNEVQVGLPVPATILRAFAGLAGTRQAANLAMRGRLVTSSEALEIGLVDELVPADQLISRCLEWAGELTALPPIAMNQTRLSAKVDFLAALDSSDDVRVTTDYWFSDETQAAMRKLVDSLGKS
jgi:3,2-trans-enoyl-CoA isomerase